MARVNITKQIKSDGRWKNVSLGRDAKGRIKWNSGTGRYIIEWREKGRRLTGGEIANGQRPHRRGMGRTSPAVDRATAADGKGSGVSS